MILNIYEKKNIVKTYKADTYDLMFGTIEDISNAMDLDSMQTGSNEEILKLAANLVIHGMDTIKDLIKDIFDGITDEEIKNTKVSELARVLVEVVEFTFKQLGKGLTEKN